MALNVEQGLISAVLRTQNSHQLNEFGINESYFHGYPEEAKFLFGHIARNRRVPSKALFRSEYPEFRILIVDDVAYYSDAVRQRHARTALTEVLSRASEALRCNDLDSAIRITYEGSINTAAKAKKSYDTDIIDDWEKIFLETKARKDRYDDTGFAGIPTGFTTIDERTGGYQPGQFIVISARLGDGKSWSLLRMATSALMAGCTVQFDALEMSRTEVSYRIHAFLSSSVGRNVFSNINLAQGKEIDLVEYKHFLRDLRKNLQNKKDSSGKLHVADSSRGRISILDIQAQIERNRPDILFVDYITLMSMKGDGDWSSIAKLTNELKQLAAYYKIPVIVAAQLNRNAVGGKEPGGPEDLGRGDSIGQDADQVYSQRLMSSRTLLIKCVKNRHGLSQFKIYCEFNPSKGVFQEVTKDIFDNIRDEDAVNS
jgi:replicative DNA helicase